MIEGFNVVEPISVQWGDMDAFGHVNNARFFTWFETARIAYFREIGLPSDLAGGIGPILAHTGCDYLSPVEYPAELLVGARATRLGGSSFHHGYVIAASVSQTSRSRRALGSSSSSTTRQRSRCRYPTIFEPASPRSTDSNRRSLSRVNAWLVVIGVTLAD